LTIRIKQSSLLIIKGQSIQAMPIRGRLGEARSWPRVANGPELPARAARSCRSRQQFCALGPPPPRTPGRADPQVPTAPRATAVRHGRIPHVYFYLDDACENTAFGLLDLEIAVCEPAGGRSVVELYCLGDGFQAGTGTARGEALMFELRDAGGVVATVPWHWPDVVCGRSESMVLLTDLPLSGADFARLDRIALPPAFGWALASGSHC
jgi:hypothetical protein